MLSSTAPLNVYEDALNHKHALQNQLTMFCGLSDKKAKMLAKVSSDRRRRDSWHLYAKWGTVTKWLSGIVRSGWSAGNGSTS
mmetsp:Transcript_15339/g.40678  ORF Transcript_15339/g.40678 Transcript_15339/m.40678 type:complete len:82 (+) Transcript_15339:21-266(+)